MEVVVFSIERMIMSEILKRIKEDLKAAMTMEIRIRKGVPDDFIGPQGAAFQYSLVQKTVSRSIISMLPSIGKKAEQATDDDIIDLLKKYISNEKERLLYTSKTLTEKDVEGLSPSQLKTLVNKKILEMENRVTSLPIIIAKKYLPKQATPEDIKEWIKINIDFSQYKNKMQAMKPIMENFRGCDGNMVKEILLREF
jgi:uncharacterized protein